jgi:hypothetical protein
MDSSTVGLPLLDLSSSSLVTSANEELTSLITMSDDVSTVSIVEQFSSSSTVGTAATLWDNETTSDLLTFSPEYGGGGGGGGDADSDYSFCRYAKVMQLVIISIGVRNFKQCHKVANQF